MAPLPADRRAARPAIMPTEAREVSGPISVRLARRIPHTTGSKYIVRCRQLHGLLCRSHLMGQPSLSGQTGSVSCEALYHAEAPSCSALCQGSAAPSISPSCGGHCRSARPLRGSQGAKHYPPRSVRAAVAFVPGGVIDTFARLMAEADRAVRQAGVCVTHLSENTKSSQVAI
jgi:hypothetical protein